MPQNDIASVTLGTVYTLVIAQHVLWPVVPDVLSSMAWVMSAITTDNLHLQRARYYLTTVSIAKAFESSVDRLRI